MLKELEARDPALFRGLIRAVTEFRVRRRALDLPDDELKVWLDRGGYKDQKSLMVSVEYHRGMALGYGIAAWTVLHGRPPKDVIEEIEVSEALRKIESAFDVERVQSERDYV